MKAAKQSGLVRDHKFESVLMSWIKNPLGHEFELRKESLLHEWLENKKSFLYLLEYFDLREQINLIVNFLDIPILMPFT